MRTVRTGDVERDVALLDHVGERHLASVHGSVVAVMYRPPQHLPQPRRLYILCWRELSRRRLLPAVSMAAGHLTTPTVAGLPGLCENFSPTTSMSSPI